MTSNNKTILFKLWQFPRLSETFIISQILIAIECGYRVKILVKELLEINEITHEKLIKQYHLNDKIIFEDYKIPTSKLLRILKALFLILFNLSDLPKLLAFIKEHKKFETKQIYEFHFFKNLEVFDIIHIQYGTNGSPIDKLKKICLLSSKIIVSFHGHDLYFPINGVIKNNGYYDNLFKYSDILVANTEYLKDLLLELRAPVEKIKTIPVAVDTNYFYPLWENKKRSEIINIITVGRLEIFKGQRYGIRCIAELLIKGYKVHYTIVGAGSQEEKLKHYIKEYKIAEHVTMTGRKSQKAIREMLLEQDIFLMTSVTDPNYGVESQGLVTAEAQACGLPVVAFDSGGIKYTIIDEKTGFLVSEYDIEAMIDKIEILIKNCELRNTIGKEAVKYIEQNFSKNKIKATWCKTYASL